LKDESRHKITAYLFTNLPLAQPASKSKVPQISIPSPRPIDLTIGTTHIFPVAHRAPAVTSWLQHLIHP